MKRALTQICSHSNFRFSANRIVRSKFPVVYKLSSLWYFAIVVQSLSYVQLLVTPWTAARQASPVFHYLWEYFIHQRVLKNETNFLKLSYIVSFQR